jgi:hypothetical protein
MTEITVDVVSGEVRPIPLPPTTVDVTLLSGSCYLCGWSLREASGDLASAISGSVVAPAAGAAIATSATQQQGTYTLTWVVELQGAAAAADANNFGLYVNGVLIETSANLPAAGQYPQNPVKVVIPAGATYQVKAIGAGTAGITYTADVSATPASDVDAQVEFRDAANIVGEASIGAGGSASQSFGQLGIQMRSGITVHVISGTVTGNVNARFAKPGE